MARYACVLLGLGMVSQGCDNPAPPAPPPPQSLPASRDVQEPVALRLRATQGSPGEAWELVAEIEVYWAMPTPAALSLALPPGAMLEEGEREEQLLLGAPGRVSRRWLIKGAGETQVTLHAEAPDHSFGFHTEKQYPTRAEPFFVRPPGPPQGRPPAPQARQAGGAR